MKTGCSFRFIYTIFPIVLLLTSTSSLLPSTTNVQDYDLSNTWADIAKDNSIHPIIYHNNRIDKDSNRIQDSLEAAISQTNGSTVFPVVITLYNPVSSRDLDYFTTLGGRINHVYRYVTYGLAGVIPVANISSFVNVERENLYIIEQDMPIRYHLDVSVPLIGVRPTVWDTYGYMGSPDNSIAVIDTGIDDSHPDLGPFGDLDFSSKIIGWYDATEDRALTPEDYGEHGTHVAGIAAGTGVANSLQGFGNIETTFTYVLPKTGRGYIDYIDVLTPGVVKLNCSWSGNNDVLLRLYDPAGSIVNQTSGRSSPLILVYDTTDTSYPMGRYRVLVGNLGGPHGVPFSCIETYSYRGANDGYNLFTGVAPNSKLVGVKVFDNTGSGTLSSLIAGMDWVIQNRMKYRIVVASMSVGLIEGATDSTLDQKANTMVKYGIVTTVAAGNDFPDYAIGSPGTAAYVITVAATNDQNGIASYSSNGNTSKNEYGLIKPDVAAPGGTFQIQYGNRIVSADSNDVDAGYSGYADRNEDDYQMMAGTSMSTPHVAGLAALIVQAFGDWHWTQDEALKVKMVISMTSFETQSGEQNNQPTLDRGDKDNVEGYGRVSANAAIEAVTMTYNVGELATDMLGPDPSDKKVWVRQVSLSNGTKYKFHLSVPSYADYDLYLYNGKPDSYGQPVILNKSVNALKGAEETIYYTPTSSGTHYIIVKWVSGSGAFNLQSTSASLHDVAVISVSPSATEAYPTWTTPLNITVVVKNEGIFSETFDVTAYYNETSIGTKTVTALAPDVNTTLVFSWNLISVIPDYYIISATAGTVSGETDLADNTKIGGTVYVKIPGDIDGDGDVDKFDFSLFAGAYGSKAGDANYILAADLDQDGDVDKYDFGAFAENYGKSL